MGAQIAAHLANAGIHTYLLDIVPKGASGKQRNALAAGAMKMMAKATAAAKMPPYMDGAFASRITVGNFDDDLERAVATSDLVVEAVVERLDIKVSLFQRVANAAPGTAILASNTSGLSIGSIAAGLPEEVRPRVVGMHFFNPPRFMHLLEVVPAATTAAEVTAELCEFSDRVLGKGVVVCRDTPNFIGNRIGTGEMLLTFEATAAGNYTIEEIDLLNGPLMGRPRTGSFRLADMVGVDILGHVIHNLADGLSGEPGTENYDELHAKMVVPEMLAKMIAAKRLGDKTGGGFYRKGRDAKGNRVIESIDLETLEYRAQEPPVFPELAPVARIFDTAERVRAAIRAEGRAGEFLRKVYLPLFNYAANRLGEICDDPKQLDDAMRWGYGWELGPFALWDAVGVAWGVEQLEKMGVEPAANARALVEAQGADARWYGGRPSAPTVFIPGKGEAAIATPAGMILLDAAADRPGAVLHSNKTARLIDIGDGVACCEFRSPKMNILDDGVLAMLREAVPTLEKIGGFRGLVIGDQSAHFCAGADLRRILKWASEGDFDALGGAVSELQDTLMDLRHGAMPVVAAPHGRTFGGGVEVCLHTAAIQADAELYMGLVEAGVGLLPAGGGLKELARRAAAWAAQVPGTSPYASIRRAFETVGGGKVSSSAYEARNLGLLGHDDRITFHRSRVIADAKRRVIGLAEAGWTPPDRDEPIAVIGAPEGCSLMLGAQMFEWGGYISAHDKRIGEKIAHVLSGGMTQTATTVRAQDLLDLEREAFCSLAGEAKTQARIEHMLKTKKPLRN
ncbi:MAG: enoyl-CoA hydratase/isomerase family protein [Myxococcales bacterium]|nr:enoyl-CoA hydratase/isomerase family protein [Myxococcales bacterium]